MKIQIVDCNSTLFSDVVILGKKNAKTLGMFPEGAFKDHAKKRQILAAIQNNIFCGYILFRYVQYKQVVSITHLCVKPEFQKQGVARFLLDAVKEKYSKLSRGISLSCRKDYLEASSFWEKYGFKAVKSTRSKSIETNYLIKWWYDFGNADLFSNIGSTSTKPKALLDANIIIKLSDEECEENKEALALKADWIDDEVDYFFAPELFNEINRDNNVERSKRTRAYIKTLTEARINVQERNVIIEELASTLPGKSTNDLSDRKQLAECIAAELSYFITMDEKLLGVTDIIYEKYSVKIIRPINFILFIDNNISGKNYNSYRLAGVRHEYTDIKDEDIDLLVEDCWLDVRKGEKKFVLKQNLISVLSDIKNSIFWLVKDGHSKTVGYFAIKVSNEKLIIKAIRTIRSKISNILFQQLVKEIIALGIDKNSSLIVLEENFLSDERLDILQSFGFESSEKLSYKILLNGQHSSTDILNRNKIINQYWDSSSIVQKIKSFNEDERNYYKLQLEKKLWPAKFTDIDIPTYIIPIKPFWAGQLFDKYISESDLFGAKPELSWGKENIYYRSVKPVSEIAPARILWYASGEEGNITGRGSSIVGTSYLDEVHVGPAKLLYQKFKNYGIYEWKDIFDLAKEKPQNDIKALKFSDTEIFKIPVSFTMVGKIMKQFGRSVNTFASPVKVSSEVYNEIYRKGKYETKE